MGERVHPHDISISTSTVGPLAIQLVPNEAVAPPPAAEPLKPGTYVIQVPKDQIYRVPAPEEARRFQEYSRRAARRRRSSTCGYCCLASLIGALLLLILALASTVLYFVFRPRIPIYSFDRISVKGLNLTTSGPISPRLDAAVRIDNPNGRIGIRYRHGGSIAVYYSGTELFDAVWPEFYQGRKNVTVLRTGMRESGVPLAAGVKGSLMVDQRRGVVPLDVGVRIPVRFKFGAVSSWSMTFKVRCDVTVDKMTADSKIVSSKCKGKLDIF